MIRITNSAHKILKIYIVFSMKNGGVVGFNTFLNRVMKN